MKIKSKAFAQITVDDDYIIRDNKPDVVRVIYTHGDIITEDSKLSNGNLWISGKLRFHSLYLSDDESKRLDSVTGEIPFQEKLVMEELEDGDKIRSEVTIEDLSVGILNSRKLMVRAVLNMSAQCLESEDCLCGYEPPLSSNYEKKTMSLPKLQMLAEEHDVIRMQKEFMLPSSKANIGEILFYELNFLGEEISLREDKAEVSVDTALMVLYRGENGEYECYESTLPLSGSIELSSVNGDELFWAKTNPVDILIESRSDYDGESRMLGLEISLGVDIQVFREENCEVLLDLYSLEKELEVETEDCEITQLLMKNLSKVRVLEQVQLPANQERILQICGNSGNITIDRVEKRPNGVFVEGVFTVHVLYNTMDDTNIFGHNVSQSAFEQFIEIEGLQENDEVWLDTGLEQLQVNLLDSTEYEVKGSIQIAVMAIRHKEIEQVVAVEEHPLDLDSLQKQPGMIGLTRRPGEDLWDIAKRYHATCDSIIEVGDKVLVMKRVQ